ncbi:MAG: hypothetical protein F6K31_17610, partial [Symploca sp. SIO2G7]|nr:hypothetical protein [Symploca sp. SIO2G7]
MKAGEIIRVIAFTFLGAGLMFFLQPWIYQNGMLRISDVSVNAWLSDDYTPGATIVFFISVFSTVLWCVMANKAEIRTAADSFRWQVVWWILLLLPILSICGALYFFNSSQDALLSLTGLFIFDAIFLLFWLPTVTSSPKDLKYILPGSFLLRR